MIFIKTLQTASKDEQEAFDGQVLGILPFRDRWVGLRRTSESESNVQMMKELTIAWLGKDLVLPSIRESEKYKQAINKGQTLHEMGQNDLAFPIEELVKNILELKI